MDKGVETVKLTTPQATFASDQRQMVLSYPAMKLRAQFVIGKKIVVKFAPNSDVMVDLEYLVTGSGHLNMGLYDVFELQSQLQNGVIKSSMTIYDITLKSAISLQGKAVRFSITGRDRK